MLQRTLSDELPMAFFNLIYKCLPNLSLVQGMFSEHKVGVGRP